MIVAIQFLAIIFATAMMAGAVFKNPENILGNVAIDTGLVNVIGILLVSSALKDEISEHIFLVLFIVASVGVAIKTCEVIRLGLRPSFIFLSGVFSLVQLWMFFPGVGSHHGVGLLVGILLFEYIQLIYSLQQNSGRRLAGGRAKSKRVEPRISYKKDGK